MHEWISSQASSGFHRRVYGFPCGEICFQTDCREIYQEVEESIRYWETPLRLPERQQLTFTLRWRQPGESMPLPSGAKLLYRNHLYPGVPLEYFGNNGWRIFRICGEDVVAADFEKGLAWGITALNSPHWSNQYLYNCVVLPPLIEWLGWHNIFMFHGGAVSWEEDGMLVMGPSGSGKTTVVLSLILAGFDFLTDDIGLLFEGDKSKVSGLPKPLNFCPDAPRLFSQISHLVPGSPGDDKQAVPLAAFAGTRSRKWCYPRIILLPEVRPESEVELIPISRQEAFDLVLPNGMFLTGLKEGSHRFSAFLHLLESTMPMRLILGKGISKLPGLIKDAFSTYKRSHGH